MMKIYIISKLKNEFILWKKKKKFVLSMWKLTLGYSTTTIAHDPRLHNCHKGTSPNMSCHWQVQLRPYKTSFKSSKTSLEQKDRAANAPKQICASNMWQMSSKFQIQMDAKNKQFHYALHGLCTYNMHKPKWPPSKLNHIYTMYIMK
jgi:hypothetical protein